MWGYHFMADAARCRWAAVRCPQHIENFSRALVKKIDMVPYGAPQIVMFGSGNKKGYTLVQLIETSNICAHFCEETNDMYLDVFSCKAFHKSDVEHMIQEFFIPESMNTRFISRQAPLK